MQLFLPNNSYTTTSVSPTKVLASVNNSLLAVEGKAVKLRLLARGMPIPKQDGQLKGQLASHQHATSSCTNPNSYELVCQQEATVAQLSLANAHILYNFNAFVVTARQNMLLLLNIKGYWDEAWTFEQYVPLFCIYLLKKKLKFLRCHWLDLSHLQVFPTSWIIPLYLNGGVL